MGSPRYIAGITCLLIAAMFMEQDFWGWLITLSCGYSAGLLIGTSK